MIRLKKTYNTYPTILFFELQQKESYFFSSMIPTLEIRELINKCLVVTQNENNKILTSSRFKFYH